MPAAQVLLVATGAAHVAVSRWSSAASPRKTAIAAPTPTSTRGSGAGTAVPGGPAGNDDVTEIAKLFASSRTATACATCNAVSARFQRRRLARRASSTPLATGAGPERGGAAHDDLLEGIGRPRRCRHGASPPACRRPDGSACRVGGGPRSVRRQGRARAPAGSARGSRRHGAVRRPWLTNSHGAAPGNPSAPTRATSCSCTAGRRSVPGADGYINGP